MSKPGNSFYVQLSFLSLIISMQVVYPSSCGITYKVSTEKRASFYGTIYLSILWRLSWTNIPRSRSISSILNWHYENFMIVELLYQRIFSLLLSSMELKRHIVNGRLLSTLPFKVRLKTKSFRLLTTLPPNFLTNHVLQLKLRLKRWLHLEQIMAAKMVTDHI